MCEWGIVCERKLITLRNVEYYAAQVCARLIELVEYAEKILHVGWWVQEIKLVWASWWQNARRKKLYADE